MPPSAAYGEPLADWRRAVDKAVADPRVAGAAPYIEKEALLSGARNQPAMVRGVLPAEEGKVSVLADKMVQGRLDSLTPGSFNIVLGKELALWLGVSIGDSVVDDDVRLPQHADGRGAATRSASPSAASSRRATTSSTRAWPWST